MSLNAQLVINVVNGQIQVTGPIHDKVLCYGLLEAAKDAIRDFKSDAHPLALPKINLPGLDGR